MNLEKAFAILEAQIANATPGTALRDAMNYVLNHIANLQTQIAVLENPPEPAGLYEKYLVINRKTGRQVTDAFVLRPETDEHARAAIGMYARSVRIENPTLREELETWLHRINEGEKK